MYALATERPNIRKVLASGLVVSCQAWQGTPLLKPEVMAAFALSAERAGAVGVRLNSPEHVKAAKQAGLKIPIISIDKRHYEGSEVYITPTRREAEALAAVGADIVAIDGTPRPRPRGERLEDLVAFIQEQLKLPVMLDISTLEEARAGDQLGAALLSTTLAGYTPYTERFMTVGPDLRLISQIVEALACPVLGEGRFHEPAQVQQALRLRAYGVVVGTALTDLEWRIRQFVPGKE